MKTLDKTATLEMIRNLRLNIEGLQRQFLGTGTDAEQIKIRRQLLQLDVEAETVGSAILDLFNVP